jgi:SAM-dependent methyltransferase
MKSILKKEVGQMNSKEKFTNKVADYVKYRPSYPQELIDYLVNEVGLSKSSAVADIGAGTGILTKLLADKVSKIFAVEPNMNMRMACMQLCSGFDSFVAVDGSAEDTTLADNSVHFATVAQAFHWFDRQKTKAEFQRILKTDGKVILIWNSRVPESELIKENDELCRMLCPEFSGFSGGSDVSPEAYSDFYKNGYCEYRVFENDVVLTLESYIGSSLSASYAPSEKEVNYKPFIDGLARLFSKYSCNGNLLLPNKTRCYVGEV